MMGLVKSKKRVLTILLTGLMSLGLAACGSLAAYGKPSEEYIIKIDEEALEAANDNPEGMTAIVEGTMSVIRGRFDGSGFTTHSIEHRGQGVIAIQISGEPERADIESLLEITGKLEFRPVDDLVPPEDIVNGIARPGSEILQMASGEGVIAVKRIGGIKGDHLVDARVEFDHLMNESVVNIQFDEEGGRKFAMLSRRLVGQRFAIIIDDEIISAPIFNEPILGGRAQISGNFTAESASQLAITLRSGALPAPVRVLQVRQLD